MDFTNFNLVTIRDAVPRINQHFTKATVVMIHNAFFRAVNIKHLDNNEVLQGKKR